MKIWAVPSPIDPPWGPPDRRNEPGIWPARVGALTVAPLMGADEAGVTCSCGIASRLALGIRPSGFPLRETTKALSSRVIPATRTKVPFGIRILAPVLLVTR